MARQEHLGTDTLRVTRPKLNDNFTEVYASTTSLANNKVDKVPGKGLSTNDYTDTAQTKVDNLPADVNAGLAEKLPLAGGTMTGEIETAGVIFGAQVDFFGFESGDLVTDGFTTTSNEASGLWSATTDAVSSGTYSAKAEPTAPTICRLKKTIDTLGEDLLITFRYQKDQDATFSTLGFSIDGVLQSTYADATVGFEDSGYFHIKGSAVELEWTFNVVAAFSTVAYVDDITTYTYTSALSSQGVVSLNGETIVNDLTVSGSVKGTLKAEGHITSGSALIGSPTAFPDYEGEMLDYGVALGYEDAIGAKKLVGINDRFSNLILPNQRVSGIGFDTQDKIVLVKEAGDARYLRITNYDITEGLGGELLLENQTIALITADSTGKAVITKEYFAANTISLDGGGKVPVSLLPAISITKVFTADDIAARNALVIGAGDGEVQEGDVVVVTDASADPLVTTGSAIYIRDASSYILLNTGFNVISINGQVGVVTLDAPDIGFTPNGDIAATNTQDAIVEVRNDTDTKLSSKYDASNPNGYETPSELDSRDTANKERANHTGTQLSSTISDFSSAVASYINAGSQSVSTLTTNNTATYSDVLNFSHSFNHIATYSVDFSWIWNYSDNRDIYVRGLVDGSTVFEFVSRPVDTNSVERYANSFNWVHLNTSIGAKTVQLQFRSQQGGDVASIYRSSIVIRRIL